jgi:hypothetical protein
MILLEGRMLLILSKFNTTDQKVDNVDSLNVLHNESLKVLQFFLVIFTKVDMDIPLMGWSFPIDLLVVVSAHFAICHLLDTQEIEE